MLIIDLIAGFVYYLLIFGVVLAFLINIVIPLIIFMFSVIYLSVGAALFPVSLLLKQMTPLNEDKEESSNRLGD